MAAMAVVLDRELAELREKLKTVDSEVQTEEGQLDILMRINVAGIINISPDDVTHKLYVKSARGDKEELDMVGT